MSTTYTYDVAQRLQAVYESGIREVTYAYDANGRRTYRRLRNGATTRYTYNLSGLVTLVENFNRYTGVSYSTFAYVYYLDGNIRQVTETMGGITRVVTYTYDTARRLTNEHDTRAGATSRAYTFDNRGNRTRMTVTGAENYTVTYTHDLNNRLLTETRITGNERSVSTLTHDRNGNQLTRSTVTGGLNVPGDPPIIPPNRPMDTAPPPTDQFTRFAGGIGGVDTPGTPAIETRTYNAFNQLVSVTSRGETSTYVYRADGLRLSKTVGRTSTTHIWCMGSIVFEQNATGGVVNRFVRNAGGQLIRSEHHGWYLFNVRGDVVQRTDNQGNLLMNYRYTAFGNELTPVDSNTNRFRFAGEHWDAHRGEYYLRARSFNPRTGRFTQPDPFWNIGNMQFGSNPVMRNGRPMPNVHAIMQSGNLFMFTMHNPVRFTDPTGLWSKDIHEELTRLALELIGAGTGMEDLFASFMEFIIAGNRGVDYPPYRALRWWSESAQSRHFNRNSANAIDSRLVWAEYYLTAAINLWLMADMLSTENWFTSQDRHNMQMDALYLLGRGLHSIQDIEAHGNIGMGWRGAAFAAHVDPRTDGREYDWSNNSRRWVTPSTEQIRFNTSLYDTINFLNRFFTAVGLN